MKRIRRVGGGLLIVLAMMLAVLPVAGALAAKKVLVLSSGGTPATVGGPGDMTVVLDECPLVSEGTLTANQAAKDVLKDTVAVTAECEAKSVTGLVTEATWASTGKVSIKGSLTLTVAGPCSYVVKSLKGTFEPSDGAFFRTGATAKLNKKGSAPSCAKTHATEVVAIATNEPFGEPFEATLK